jgi:hypothetical protein
MDLFAFQPIFRSFPAVGDRHNKKTIIGGLIDDYILALNQYSCLGAQAGSRRALEWKLQGRNDFDVKALD